MQSEGSRPHAADTSGVEWRWEAIGDPDAPDAYRFSLVPAGSEEPACEVTLPAAVIAKAVFSGRRPELIIDPEEGRLMVAGQGLDDDLLDALTSAFSDTRVLALAADLIESDGVSMLAHHGSRPGRLQAELARLRSAVSAAEHRLGQD